MEPWPRTLATGTMAFMISSSGMAHHSVAYEYIVNSRGEIRGIVSEVWFKNPHVRYYVTVTDDAGNETTWDAHGHNPATLVKTGCAKDVIRAGDSVTIMGDSTRDGSPRLFIRTIELSDGRILISTPGANNHVAAEAPE